MAEYIIIFQYMEFLSLNSWQTFREGKAIKSAFGIQARINEPCPTLAASKFQMGIKAIVFKLAALCSNLCQLTVCMIDLDLLTFKGINWGGGMYLRLDSLTSGSGQFCISHTMVLGPVYRCVLTGWLYTTIRLRSTIGVNSPKLRGIFEQIQD